MSEQQQVQSAWPGHSTEVSGDARAMMIFEANRKSVLVSYLFWFFLGGCGAHRFYNGKTGSGLSQIALLILGFALMLGGLAMAAARGSWSGASIGIFLLVVLGIWLLIDAFLIPGWVRGQNNRLAMQLSDR